MTTKDEKKICFVISPIGEEDSDIRKHSDQVLKYIITSVVEQLGYEVIRADKISKPGMITHQIINHIVDASLVVADLTERNPNVFYELALRHAIRKPLVQLIKKGEAIPFDVLTSRIIPFDLNNLDSVELAKGEILAQIKSLEGGKEDTDNPISISLDLKVLKESANPKDRSFADVVEAISDLRLAVTSGDNGIISVKFMDELKILIDSLPSKIENRLDLDKRRKRRFHPIMFDDMLNLEMKSENPNLSFLIIISYFKEDFPWLYEIGLETYRGLISTKSTFERKEQVETFYKALELLSDPRFRDIFGDSKEMLMYSKDIKQLLKRYFDRFADNDYPF